MYDAAVEEKHPIKIPRPVYRPRGTGGLVSCVNVHREGTGGLVSCVGYPIFDEIVIPDPDGVLGGILVQKRNKRSKKEARKAYDAFVSDSNRMIPDAGLAGGGEFLKTLYEV